MVSGERRSWVVKFRVTDRKFLHCVARVWQQAIAHLPPSSCEDTITVALVDGLSMDAEARSEFYCEYQFDMYLVKPNRKRFWMRSCALVHAERIAIDLRH